MSCLLSQLRENLLQYQALILSMKLCLKPGTGIYTHDYIARELRGSQITFLGRKARRRFRRRIKNTGQKIPDVSL